MLHWDDCGNSRIDYQINWCKDNTIYQAKTTRDNPQTFFDLKPGSYSFRVSAGGGKNSDDCFFIVPEKPALTVEVISCTTIRASCSLVDHADSYLFKLAEAESGSVQGMEAGLGPSAEVLDREFRPVNGENWIDISDFEFHRGVEYLMTVQAGCGIHFSIPDKKYFRTGLGDPTDFKCETDQKNPSAVRCTWKPSAEMKLTQYRLLDLNGEVIQEGVTEIPECTFNGLRPYRKYKLALRGSDGKEFAKEEMLSPFTTAPGPPEKLDCSANPDIETQIDVTVVSDYEGPFVLTVVDADGNDYYQEPIVAESKNLALTNLEPGGGYKIYAQTKFQGILSEKTAFVGSD